MVAAKGIPLDAESCQNGGLDDAGKMFSFAFLCGDPEFFCVLWGFCSLLLSLWNSLRASFISCLAIVFIVFVRGDEHWVLLFCHLAKITDLYYF